MVQGREHWVGVSTGYASLGQGPPPVNPGYSSGSISAAWPTVGTQLLICWVSEIMSTSPHDSGLVISTVLKSGLALCKLQGRPGPMLVLFSIQISFRFMSNSFYPCFCTRGITLVSTRGGGQPVSQGWRQC